jgi:hypothetical protein
MPPIQIQIPVLAVVRALSVSLPVLPRRRLLLDYQLLHSVHLRLPSLLPLLLPLSTPILKAISTATTLRCSCPKISSPSCDVPSVRSLRSLRPPLPYIVVIQYAPSTSYGRTRTKRRTPVHLQLSFCLLYFHLARIQLLRNHVVPFRPVPDEACRTSRLKYTPTLASVFGLLSLKSCHLSLFKTLVLLV